jgi:Spy/CpxP family protein refolding chaperone
MKKLLVLAIGIGMVSLSFAQVQRKATVKTDTSATTQIKPDAVAGKKQMMRELDLSKEQKAKLKEIRQSGKAQKEAIEGDDKLSATEKETKLKALRKEQAKNTMAVLNEEQKARMMQMRKEKKDKNAADMETE